MFRPALCAFVLAVWFVLPAFQACAQPPFAPAAGTEDRRWLDGPPTAANSSARVPVTVQDGVRVITRDGIALDGRLILPVLPAGSAPTPCVLMANGYGRQKGRAAVTALFDIATRGYAVLHLSMRGAGKSGGSNDLYGHYGEDGYDAVEWMAHQPWCNGRVGMVGSSLLGISQWLTAKEGPPSLKAIVPEAACGDCYRYLWYPGGMLPGPGREARRAVTGTEYDSAIQHRDLDAWWRARSTDAADNAAIAARGVAAFVAGGLDDYITPASVRAFQEFIAPDARKRLLLGPYGHGWHTAVIQELQVQWLDHWLKGIDNGAETAPRVMVYIQGANRWRYEDDWPIADAHATTLFLSARHSSTIASRNAGTLGLAPAPGPPVTVPYSPQTGPFLTAMLGTGGRLDIDQAPDEEEALTWTSTRLPVATEVTGLPVLSLWIAASAPDADLVAQISDVAPDGTSRQVVQGYLNLPRAVDPSAPVPLVPGEPCRFKLETYPVAYVFHPGHRIRLSLSGGTAPAPNQAFPQGPGKGPEPFNLTVLQDAAHPATLVLPVVGTGWRAMGGIGMASK